MTNKLRILNNLGQKLPQRAGWALVDQALYGVSNFLANTLMARWLEPDAYGAFAFGWMILIMSYQLQNPLIVEPMLVFTANRFRLAPYTYQQIVVQLNWLLSLGLSAGAIGLALLQRHSNYFWIYLGLALAFPLVLYAMAVRRICYANLTPAFSAQGGLVYLLIFVSLAWLAWQTNWLSAFSALCFVGLASYGAGWWVERSWKRTAAPSARIGSSPLRGSRLWLALVRVVLRSHWHYGRWGLPSSFLWVAVATIPYLILVRTHGLETVAQLRVLENTALPVFSVMAAFNSLLIPSFARAQTKKALSSLILRYILLFSFMGLSAWLVLGAFHSKVFWILYGDNYQQISFYLLMYGSVPFLAGVAGVFLAALRSRERVQWVTLIYTLATIFVLVFGFPAIQSHGLAGAVVTICAVNLLQIILSALFWWRYSRIDTPGRIGKGTHQH